ncbi:MULTISPECIES: hypothetical protein [unclassified Paenibacillus]|uniref:hypothetical protein n=1 Tax=unclassified Paenibacillus TaxID=185978 RepID=UPI0030FA19E7
MKKVSLLGSYRHYMILGLLLLVFILGFYGLSNIYALSSIDSRTVVLKSSQFNTSLISSNTEAFEIKAVTKLTNNYPIYDLQVRDHNNVILSVPDNSLSGLKIAVLHLDNNQMSDIAENVEYGITLTPDAKQLIYSRFEYGGESLRTNVYSLELNKDLKQLNNDNSYSNMFIDHERYLGLSGSDVILTNVSTGEVQQLITYDQLLELIGTAIGSSNLNGITIRWDIIQKSGQNKVCFLAEINSSYGIFEMDLKNTSKVKLVAKSEQINQFLVMNNGDFVLQGKINNTDGLFQYNRGTSQFKLLKEGIITNYALQSDESRIAYFMLNSNQTGDLHTAYLENGSLDSDTVIYQNIHSAQTMKWHEDDLFIIGSQLSKSEIYRFSF